MSKIIPKVPYIRVKVLPKSNKNEISEVLEAADGEKTFKIRIKAAPEKNKANKELIKFLSDELNLAQENITIISGKTESTKLLKLKWN